MRIRFLIVCLLIGILTAITGYSVWDKEKHQVSGKALVVIVVSDLIAYIMMKEDEEDKEKE